MLKIIVVFMALVFYPVSLVAGSLGYTNVSSYMNWEPDCTKPSQPSFYVSSRSDYNYAVDEFNNYVAEVRSYLDCLSSEAESDSRTVVRAISNGAEENRSEVISEVESAKNDLQMQRPY